MPDFLPGDWIKRPKRKTIYRVVRVCPDGQVTVQHPSGQVRLLTRPELYRKVAPPKPNHQTRCTH